MAEGQPPGLSRFAAEVQALRESRMAPKVGVIAPTFNRPDLARFCVLQFAAQSRPPDIVCVHQNGLADSYRWAVEDVRRDVTVAWLHTAADLPQHNWYAIPLRYLIEQGCSHFFWADHDDLYLRDHVEKGLEDLKDCDFSVSPRCGVLYTRPADFRYAEEVEFVSHAVRGMSSTMCFRRNFARELLADLEADRTHGVTQDVIAKVTMPKFQCKVSGRRTAIYHAHEGALTSSGWLPDIFGDATNKA
jgi:hypothetical protein